MVKLADRIANLQAAIAGARKLNVIALRKLFMYAREHSDFVTAFASENVGLNSGDIAETLLKLRILLDETMATIPGVLTSAGTLVRPGVNP